MALAWSQLEDWNKAIAAYQDALKIRPDNPVAIFKLGEAYEKTGQLGKAVEQYRLGSGKGAEGRSCGRCPCRSSI